MKMLTVHREMHAGMEIVRMHVLTIHVAVMLFVHQVNIGHNVHVQMGLLEIPKFLAHIVSTSFQV